MTFSGTQGRDSPPGAIATEPATAPGMTPQDVAVRLERQAMLPTCGTGAPTAVSAATAAGVTELPPVAVTRTGSVASRSFADLAVRRIGGPGPVFADLAVQGEDAALQFALNIIGRVTQAAVQRLPGRMARLGVGDALHIIGLDGEV